MFLSSAIWIPTCTYDGLPLSINVEHLVHERKADQLGRESTIPLGGLERPEFAPFLVRGGEHAHNVRDAEADAGVDLMGASAVIYEVGDK